MSFYPTRHDDAIARSVGLAATACKHIFAFENIFSIGGSQGLSTRTGCMGCRALLIAATCPTYIWNSSRGATGLPRGVLAPQIVGSPAAHG
jgi:hypothetical protein